MKRTHAEDTGTFAVFEQQRYWALGMQPARSNTLLFAPVHCSNLKLQVGDYGVYTTGANEVG